MSRYGMCHFLGCLFFEQNINVGVSCFGKNISSHKFWGLILENSSLGY